jgi:putative ABC transport system permease protein
VSAGAAALVLRSRLRAGDAFKVGAVGLRSRRLRATLSALGVAIGIASLIAVIGISESSKADLLAQLDGLGTNLLTVSAGQSFIGKDTKLPATATGSASRMTDTQATSFTAAVTATVRRSDKIDQNVTGGISVQAVDPKLLSTLAGRVAQGGFLNAASSRYPAVVLGADAARVLGIDGVWIDGRPVQVWMANHWFTVVGILEPITLVPDLDRAALVGPAVARDLLGWDGAPSTIYVRTNPDRVDQARDLLPRTVEPDHPEQVQVSRPSDVIAAKAAAKGAFTSLFLGLGAVALLVGGVGIANVMFVSVLERRGEIGLRRALGATKAHVGVQFLTESFLLSGLGGVAGVALGAAITAAYVATQGWVLAISTLSVAGGFGAALAIGAVAGLYPALRAARLAPTEALRSV